MAELHTADIIDDADVADDNEIPVRLAGVAGLLRLTLGKIKAHVLDGFSGGGVPDGGTTGQVLTKLSGTDGDADWQDPTGGSGGGGGRSLIARAYASAATAALDTNAAILVTDMSVTFTLSEDAPVFVQFDALMTRTAGKCRMLIYVDSVPHDYESPQPSYSVDQGELNVHSAHIGQTIELEAGEHTIEVYAVDALSNADTTFYERTLRIESSVVSSGGGGGDPTFRPPVAADFTVFKASTPVIAVTDHEFGMAAEATTVGAGYNDIAILAKDASGWGTEYKLTARIQPGAILGQYPWFGLAFLNSANDNVHVVRVGSNGAISSSTSFVSVGRIDDFSDGASNDGLFEFYGRINDVEWFEIERDGSTLYFRYSANGVHWQERTADLTHLGADPTHVGIVFNTYFDADGSGWDDTPGILVKYYADPDNPA